MGARVAMYVLISAGGCGFQVAAGGAGSTCTVACEAGTNIDAAPSVDAFLDAGHNCFGTGTFVICLDEPDVPTQPLSVGTQTPIDTTTCPLMFTPPSGPPWCVMTGTSITISSKLLARGASPLVLLATQDVTITSSGIVDVASNNVNEIGAGANYDPGCNANVPPGPNNGQGAGGGGGGSFGTRGGTGGRGTGGSGGAGGQGGNVVAAPVGVLRGGCAGGRGGLGGSFTSNGGDAGNGGGAVYLVAGNLITVDGIVNASGGGGHHGLAGRGGGGGGGSGGMIVLAAATTSIGATGKLVANGGGGAGGAANSGLGVDGGDPQPTTPQVPAPFGPGNGANAGPGAIGAVGTNPGGTAIDAGDGAGAGGGGVGVIRILVGTPASGSGISPPATN